MRVTSCLLSQVFLVCASYRSTFTMRWSAVPNSAPSMCRGDSTTDCDKAHHSRRTTLDDSVPSIGALTRKGHPSTTPRLPANRQESALNEARAADSICQPGLCSDAYGPLSGLRLKDCVQGLRISALEEIRSARGMFSNGLQNIFLIRTALASVVLLYAGCTIYRFAAAKRTVWEIVLWTVNPPLWFFAEYYMFDHAWIEIPHRVKRHS